MSPKSKSDFLKLFIKNYRIGDNVFLYRNIQKAESDSICNLLKTAKPERFLIACRKNPVHHHYSDIFNAAAQNEYEVFLLDSDKRNIFRISENYRCFSAYISQKKSINLFFIKKSSSAFIFFISHSFKKGGSERSLLDLLDGLIKKGVLCHVLLPGHGILVNELEKLPVSIGYSEFPWWARNNIYKKSRYENQKEIKKAKKNIVKQLMVHDPHLVYTNTSVINVGAIAAKEAGKPHIWHIREFGSRIHGIDFYHSKSEIAKFLYDNSMRIIFNSNTLREYYENNMPADKSVVVYNSINLSKVSDNFDNGIDYFSNKDALKLITIGAVFQGKGQLEAVKAIRKIIERNNRNIEFIIIGGIDPAYGKEIETEIAKGQLENNVRLLGYIDNPFPALSQSDVFVMCSREEAFGRVTAEAILMKKPVIAARSGGTVELVKDGVNGLLYEPGNIDNLAEKILFLQNNRHLIEAYGKNGSEFAKSTFIPENYSGRIYGEIRDAIASTKNSKTNRNDSECRKYLEKLARGNTLSSAKRRMKKINIKSKLDLAGKGWRILNEMGMKSFFKNLYKFARYGRKYFK